MRTAGELAELLGLKLQGDAQARLSGVASPERAKSEDLIYIESAQFAERAAASEARCVVAPAGAEIRGKTVLEAKEPKLAFAKAAALVAGETAVKAGVHPTAMISASARVDASAHVAAYAVIEAHAEIGAGSEIGAFCFVGEGARIGEGCRLHPRVTVYAGAKLGARVEVHSGTVLGSPGFGYVFGEGRYWRFPQAGGLEIASDVEIGANTTVDRGSLETTRIAEGVKIDNLVQVAHNVEIGEHTVVASQTGISGSSVVGKRVLVGGQVGIADHCEIEDGAVLGAQAGIPTGKRIRGGQVVWGTPARPLDKFKEQYAWFAKLPELAERLRKLERRNSGEPERK